MSTLDNGLALPVLATLLLTLLVWIYLFIQRISYCLLYTSDAADEVVPV
mgnify:CR=1 FL=1